MKICDIAQFYSPLSGGVKRYLADKARFLAARGDSQHVLIVPAARDAVIRGEHGTRYEIKSPRLVGSQSYRLLVARRRIIEIVMQERPDLIEVGDPYRTAWIGLEAAHRIHVPIVAYYHSDFPRGIGRTLGPLAGSVVDRLLSAIVRRYVVRLYNRMDATAVASARLQETLDRCGIRRTTQVPLGTDLSIFKPQPQRGRLRAELGIADDERMILYVGRLAREKNLAHLLSASARIDRDCPIHRLVLVGDGELRNRVAREVRRRPDMAWMPYCDSPTRLAELYTAADLFVHPGTFETFGIVSLEAQACGTPVLAVRGGGVEDTLVDEPPRLAADGSAEALAAGITTALRVGDTAADRARRRQRMEQLFSIATTFERLFALYRHLIARRPVSEFAVAPARPGEQLRTLDPAPVSRCR